MKAAVGGAPAGVLVEVSGRIPPIAADIAAAADGQAIVDHHDLLMVGPKGDGVIEAKVHPRVLEPAVGAVGKEILGHADGQIRTPDQNPDVEVRPGRRQIDQELADPVGSILGPLAVRHQARARIEAPAEQPDLPPRLAQNGDQSLVIGLVVDQECRPVRRLDPPAGAVRLEEFHIDRAVPQSARAHRTPKGAPTHLRCQARERTAAAPSLWRGRRQCWPGREPKL